MKPKSYIASPLEVKAAIDGTLTNLIIPFAKKEYPDPESDGPYPAPRILGNEDDWGKFIWETAEGETILKDPPYHPDSIIYFREAWGQIDFSDGESCWLYKSDESELHQQVGYAEHFSGWNSPATMPQAAARIYVKAGNPTAELRDGIWGWLYPVTIESTTGKTE